MTGAEGSTGGGVAGALMIVFFVLTGAFLYLLPSIVGYFREHHNRGAIFAVNLLLGWSFIGWVIAFVWACTNASSTVVVQQYASAPGTPPGWHPDPWGQAGLRWWDGTGWTGDTR